MSNERHWPEKLKDRSLIFIFKPQDDDAPRDDSSQDEDAPRNILGCALKRKEG